MLYVDESKQGRQRSEVISLRNKSRNTKEVVAKQKCLCNTHLLDLIASMNLRLRCLRLACLLLTACPLIRTADAGLAPSSVSPSITIYSTLREFDSNKREAIQSWCRLGPQVKRIVLVGQLHELQTDVGLLQSVCSATTSLSIHIEDRVDTNFLGRPLFNSLMYLTLTAETDIAMYVNADIHVLYDLILGLNRVHQTFPSFVAMAARWDVIDTTNLLSTSSVQSLDSVREWVITSGTLHSYGGVDMWAFDTKTPLIDSLIPPFVTGRGKYDNWLTHELIRSSRANIDLTEAVTLVHCKHERNASNSARRRLGNKHTRLEKRYKNYWSSLDKKSSFELFTNTYLAYTHGTYRNQQGTALHIPLKMSKCLSLDGHSFELCILKRIRPGICNCEFSTMALSTTSDPRVDSNNNVICGKRSLDAPRSYNLEKTLVEGYNRTVGIPHTLPQLISVIAPASRVVIVSAASYSNREVVMSGICNFRELKITNFVIAALDKEMYSYLYVRGVPVFYQTVLGFSAESIQIKIATEILLLGFNVLWSDFNVVWLSNPIQVLIKAVEGDATEGRMLVQSTEIDPAKPSNVLRSISSAFFFAMASQQTVTIFESMLKQTQIVPNADTMRLGDRLYDTVCGVDGKHRVGESQCLSDGMRMLFLDSKLFPYATSEGMRSSTNLLVDFPSILVFREISMNNGTLKQGGLNSFDETFEVCAWNWIQKMPK